MIADLPSWIFPVLSFLLVLGLVPLGRNLALRIGYLDQPGGRKNHTRPTPPIGGMIIVPVFILISMLSGAEWQSQGFFWLALLIIMLAGVLDDSFSIKPRWKFLAQFIAAGLVVYGGAQVDSLGNLFGFGTVWLSWMNIPFSIIATVLLINAINLIDGLDGLAGGKSFIALLWMFIPACVVGFSGPALSMSILMGTLAAFLIYNMRNPLRRKANIFLGDAGSMALGLSLAWFGINLGRGTDPVIYPISVAWILALPIMDTCAQFARRISQGRHPFSADRNHFHHHFVNAGVSIGQATAIMTVLGFVLGFIGVCGMALGISEYILAYAWIALLFLHIYMNMRPARFRRLILMVLRRKEPT